MANVYPSTSTTFESTTKVGTLAGITFYIKTSVRCYLAGVGYYYTPSARLYCSGKTTSAFNFSYSISGVGSASGSKS